METIKNFQLYYCIVFYNDLIKMNIHICCPICSKTADIEVSKKKLGKASRGLLSISIPADVVCKHSFIAYIDRNNKVRDIFVPDFEINLRGLETIETEGDKGDIMGSPLTSEQKGGSKKGLPAPNLPPDCKAGDLIEQQYNDDTLLSYIFTINKSRAKKQLFSFSILIGNSQKVKLFKLVIQDFIEYLEQSGLLNEKILKNYQGQIYSSFNQQSDVEIEGKSIPLSEIFKQKEEELKEVRMEELKGSFF